MPRKKGSQNKGGKGSNVGGKRNPPPPPPPAVVGPASQDSSTSHADNRSNPSNQNRQQSAAGASTPQTAMSISDSSAVASTSVSQVATSVQPVEQRWEESEGMYLHKKFKKMASSASAVPALPPPSAATVESSPSDPPPPVLKHSALSMLHSPQPVQERHAAAPQPEKASHPSSQQQPSTSHETSPNSKKKNVCSYCQLVCAKPSVLEKHMRTHTNERPYPCEACGFAFKTKSNLYKHRKSRTHNLKVEKGIDSSKEEIMAELGESGQEEAIHSPPETWHQPQPQYLVSTGSTTTAGFAGTLGAPSLSYHMVKNPHDMSIATKSLTAPTPVNLIRKSPESSLPIHPSMAVEALVGLERAQQLPRPPPPPISTNPVLTSSDFLPKVPSLSVSRCQQPNRPSAALEPHNLTTMHPEPLAIHSLVQTPTRPQGFEIIPARSHQQHHHQQPPAGHVIRLPQQPHPQVSLHAPQAAVVQLPQQPIRAAVPSQVAALVPTDLSISGVPQRIDKLISENQAIVESDWPKRFSRQNSKDGTSKEDQQQQGVMPPALVADPSRKRRASGAQFSLSKVPAVTTSVLASAGPAANPPVHQLMQVKPIESLREPVTTAELLPLNLTAATSTAAYQRRTSESSTSSHHTPIQANSIKELWLNSCKQSPAVMTHNSKVPSVVGSGGTAVTSTVKLVQHEDLDNNTAAFHPQNPEGSMIKELLLKHRMQEQQRAAAAAAAASLSNKSTTVTTPCETTAYHSSKAKVMLPTVVTAKHNEVPTLKRPMDAPPGSSTSSVEPKRLRETIPGLPNGLLQITRPLMPEQTKAQEQHVIGPPPSMRVLGAAIHKFPTVIHPPAPVEPPVPAGITGPSYASNASSLTISKTSSVSSESTSAPAVTIKVEKPSEDGDTPSSASSSAETAVTTIEDPKFLRPSSLPLTAGSFKPKPNIICGATTGPGATLVSPDTPRPKKSYALQYQNGTAYTFLTGMRTGTKVYYTTINQAQPSCGVNPAKPQLSMYSNWKQQADAHPSKLPVLACLASYNSRAAKGDCGQAGLCTTAGGKTDMMVAHSSQWSAKPSLSNLASARESPKSPRSSKSKSSSPDPRAMSSSTDSSVRKVEGGFKTQEDVKTYVRGRGRGRYVCESCGIRCKKPSMLKKHAKTHSNLRPFTCRFCNFAFKTKGNLTKHMKSKAHHKKCVEIGVVPVPTNVEDLALLGADATGDNPQGSSGVLLPGDDSDNEEGDEEDDQFDDADEDIDVVGLDSSDESVTASPVKQPQQNTYLAPTGGLVPPRPMLSFSIFTTSSSSASTATTSTTAATTTTTTSSQAVIIHRHNSVTASSTAVSGVKKSDGCVSLLSPQAGSKERYYFLSSTSNRSPSNDAKFINDVIQLSTKVVAQADVLPPPSISVQQVVKLPQVPQNPLLVVPPGNTGISVSKISLQKKSDSETSGDSQHGNTQQGSSTTTAASIIAAKNMVMNVQGPSSSGEVTAASIAAAKNLVLSQRNPTFASPNKPPLTTAPTASPNEAAELDKKSKLDAICKEVLAQSSMQLAPGTVVLLDKKQAVTAGGSFPPVPKLPSSSSKLDHHHHSYAPRNVTMNVKDLPPITGTAAAAATASSAARPQLPQNLLAAVPRDKATAGGPKIDLSSLGGGQNSPPPNVNAPASAPIPKQGLPTPTKGAAQLSPAVPGPSSSAAPPLPPPPPRQADDEDGDSITDIYQTNEEGKPVCGICQKVFPKHGQLRIHVQIHYFERPFKCEACSVSFRSKGHLQKHKRSVGHFNKVNINATFGAPSTSNPRPFKCIDCKIAFRIHGHLAKHLRSKMHIMKLECSGQLPIGMFAEMERLGTNLNEIDTSDCENSLESLKIIATRLYANKDSLISTSAAAAAAVAATAPPPTEEVPEIKTEIPSAVSSPKPIMAAVTVSQQQQQSLARPIIIEQAAPGTSGRVLTTQASQDEASTDSDTDSLSSTGRSMKCQQCPKTFYDMKSLQIHNFIDHHKQPPSTTQSVTPSSSAPAAAAAGPTFTRLPNNPFPTLNFNKASPPTTTSVPPPPSSSVVITRPGLPVVISGPPPPLQLPPPTSLVVGPPNTGGPPIVMPPGAMVIRPSSGPPPVQQVMGGPVAVSLPVLPPPPPAVVEQAQIRPTSRPGSSSSSVTSESELGQTYSCDLCGVTGLPSRLAFKQHLLSHTRPFVCQRCDAGFTNQQQLEAHMVLHLQQQ